MTTQELREEHIRDLLMWHLEQDTHNVDILMEAIDSYAKTLIAKHETELVENVIGADEGYDESAVLLDTNTVIATKIKAQNDLRAEQRAKLTALTEKESKE